jgi:hypothetical protein
MAFDSSTFSVELVFMLALSMKLPSFAGRIPGCRSTVDDELDVFGQVSGHFSHDVATEKFDH